MFKLLSEELYKSEKIYYEKSLNFAKNMKSSENSKLVFHCFWRVPRNFGRKQSAVIKSIIAAHQNRLKDLEIFLWSNVDLTSNEYFQEVREFVNFKIWDLKNEIKGTILEDCFYLKSEESVKDDFCWLEGDLFRLLILNKYGGFYIDMDALVLQDMSPLNDFEFLYQWGTSGHNQAEPTMIFNGAIMRLDKNSPASKEYLEILKTIAPQKNSTSWGHSMYSRLKNDIWIFPCVWFDSEWGFEGAVNDPFNKNEKNSLFEGAFTWHWHGKYEQEIQLGSKFEILETRINSIFKDLKKISKKQESQSIY